MTKREGWNISDILLLLFWVYILFWKKTRKSIILTSIYTMTELIERDESQTYTQEAIVPTRGQLLFHCTEENKKTHNDKNC